MARQVRPPAGSLPSPLQGPPSARQSRAAGNAPLPLRDAAPTALVGGVAHLLIATPVPGVALGGLLPESIQTHLTYVAGILAHAGNATAAEDFLHYATTGDRAAVLRSAGFTHPT